MELRQLLERFLYEKQEYNLSEKTIATYKFHCCGYIDFVQNGGLYDVTIACDKDNYIGYLGYLKDKRKIRDISVASYARSIKAWFYWLMENKYIDQFRMQIPKYQETVPETYSDYELGILLKRPQSGCTQVEYITWVMVNVLIATGARLSSLRNIKVRDFSYNESTISINTTKNNHSIKLPVNEELCMILIEYINKLHLSPNDYLFCSGTGDRYAARTIEDYIMQYNKDRFVYKRRIVHAFRHTFAKNEYLASHDVYKLKEILGHQNLSMTESYLRSLGCALEETIEYNPQRKHKVNSEPIRKTRRGNKVVFESEESGLTITSNQLPF